MPKRIMEGKVVSNACDKTVTVLVERRVTDPLYKKVVRRSAKYAAHDPQNICQLGDQVEIQECPRVSKRKSWVVISGGTGKPSEKRIRAGQDAAVEAVDTGKIQPKKAKKADEETVAEKTDDKK
ncbi:MAG: 30S ribosomal protein S17 [Pseudomonadota bacterium]|nr:30S ribosomal protein S17 [Pseudomonadota bacterium]QKK05390.1 MAG: 30S ribosomal protein S17 [Pseudomonadota bacterium]